MAAPNRLKACLNPFQCTAEANLFIDFGNEAWVAVFGDDTIFLIHVLKTNYKQNKWPALSSALFVEFSLLSNCYQV